MWSFYGKTMIMSKVAKLTLKLRKEVKVVDVSLGTNLMEAIIDAGVPIGNSCDGEGVCAKCWVNVLEGATNLTKPSKLETDLVIREKIPEGRRISCLVRTKGDV